MPTPRGIRNNNPGNLRLTPTRWVGQVAGCDRQFCAFSSMAYGYRALLKVLITYMRKHHLVTLEQIIPRYAPPHENNTALYIAKVARLMEVNPSEKLYPNQNTLIALASAISEVENGIPANPSEVNDGYKLLNT